MNKKTNLVTISRSKEGYPVAHVGGIVLDRESSSSIEHSIKSRLQLLSLQDELSDLSERVPLLVASPKIVEDIILQIDTSGNRLMLSSEKEHVEVSKNEWGYIMSLIVTGFIEGVIPMPGEIKSEIQKQKVKDRLNMDKLPI